MSETLLRPRSATELVDASFQLYRREPLQFMVGLGLIYVPWLLILAATGLTATMRAGVVPAWWAGLVLGIGGILVYIFANGVTTMIANDVYFGRAANVGRAFASVGRRAGQLLGAMLAVVALMLVMLLLGGIVAGVFVAFLGPVMTFVAVIGIFAGAIYLFARFFAVKQIVLIEHASAVASIARSSFLSADNKWHVIGTIGLVMLINIAFLGGVMLLDAMIPSQAVQLLVQTAVSVIVYPLLGIAETLLYYDVRIRREGFDIEYLASIAPPQPTPPTSSQPTPT